MNDQGFSRASPSNHASFPPPSGKPLIDLQNLEVRYGRLLAFQSESVQLTEGVTGLLGPNGAGKSTLLKTILGLLQPTQGTGTVLGLPLDEAGVAIRSKIGYMSENDSFVPNLSSVEFVSLAGELGGMPPRDATRRAHEVLSYLGLDEARYRKLEEYSTGMKQRLKLAQALVHDPQLLILDEPTNGLDPTGRQSMLDLIQILHREHGKSILISTHLLEDVEKVADSILVLREGNVIASGKIEELLVRDGVRYLLELSGGERQAFLNFLFDRNTQLIEVEPLRKSGPAGDLIRLHAQEEWDSSTVFKDIIEYQKTTENYSVQVRSLVREKEKLENLFKRFSKKNTKLPRQRAVVLPSAPQAESSKGVSPEVPPTALPTVLPTVPPEEGGGEGGADEH